MRQFAKGQWHFQKVLLFEERGFRYLEQLVLPLGLALWRWKSQILQKVVEIYLTALWRILCFFKGKKKQIPGSQLKYENFMNTILDQQKPWRPWRTVYENLISNQAEWPLSSQEGWQNQCKNWMKKSLRTVCCVHKGFHINWLQFQIFTWTASNQYFSAKKIGIREGGTCTFCHNKKEDLLHLFWGREKSRNFWNHLSKWP